MTAWTATVRCWEVGGSVPQASVRQQWSRQKEQVGGSFIRRAENCDYAFSALARERSPQKSPGTGPWDNKIKVLTDKTLGQKGNFLDSSSKGTRGTD